MYVYGGTTRQCNKLHKSTSVFLLQVSSMPNIDLYFWYDVEAPGGRRDVVGKRDEKKRITYFFFFLACSKT